uniref:Transposase MuDR plant domain-containing protein n=3 Tax=Brassica oleracea TaxID=3712 RepID=A0A0D3A097_BRAOL
EESGNVSESEDDSWSDLRATNDESDENDEALEEDIDMINNNYGDEIPDEGEVYPDTEASSDEEEEQAKRMARAGLLDGVLSLRQTFSSGEEFKKQVISYILKTRRNVVYDRWEKTKIGARCNGKGCPWRIY